MIRGTAILLLSLNGFVAAWHGAWHWAALWLLLAWLLVASFAMLPLAHRHH